VPLHPPFDGPRLRRAIKASPYTHGEVAARVGVTRQTIGNWENGRTRPDPRVVGRVATVLGVDYRAFYDPSIPLRGSIG
jgi:transcriptional regulator with XRE-family HTH domain